MTFDADGGKAAEMGDFLAGRASPDHGVCLLYTSDAADARSSVDLGGRRIIKKKNKSDICSLSQASHTVTTHSIYQNTTDSTSNGAERDRGLQ